MVKASRSCTSACRTTTSSLNTGTALPRGSRISGPAETSKGSSERFRSTADVSTQACSFEPLPRDWTSTYCLVTWRLRCLRFRFSAMLQRAREAADRAAGFGQSLLSAIEKRESEELARLRSGHEIGILKAAKTVRDEQLREAKESLEALKRSLEAAQARFDFYSSRDALISGKERAEGDALNEAVRLEQPSRIRSGNCCGLGMVAEP